MTIYEELVKRGLIAQVTNEAEIKEMVALTARDDMLSQEKMIYKRPILLWQKNGTMS